MKPISMTTFTYSRSAPGRLANPGNACPDIKINGIDGKAPLTEYAKSTPFVSPGIQRSRTLSSTTGKGFGLNLVSKYPVRAQVGALADIAAEHALLAIGDGARLRTGVPAHTSGVKAPRALPPVEKTFLNHPEPAIPVTQMRFASISWQREIPRDRTCCGSSIAVIHSRREDSMNSLGHGPNSLPAKVLGFAILIVALVIVPTVVVLAANADQLPWPQFRGPDATGIGDGKPPVEFAPNKNVVWKTPIESGLSSPVIARGRVFLTEFDRTTIQLSTLCIDQKTGRILWRRSVMPTQIEKVHEISSPAASTPATDGERVYVYFGSYGLISYNFDGKVQWERRLPIPENIYGAVSSPILAGGLLVLNHQGKEAYLLGINRRDGQTVWKTDRSRYQYGWSTPVYWRHDGTDEIAVLGGDFQPNQRLMVYNLADGKERWWVAGLPPCGKSTPVIGGGLLFFAAPDIIMEPAGEKANPDRAARMYANNGSRVVAVRPGGQQEVNQTHVVWSEHKGVPGVPSPLYYNGRLYTFQNGGIVFARNAQTGALVYSGRTGAPGYYYSSPVAADNKIYIASEEGVVVVLDAGEQLNVLARNGLDGRIMATPAIVSGRLYVRSDGMLYAFGAASMR